MTTRLSTFVLPGLFFLATMSLCAQSPCPDKVLTTSTTASVNTEKPSMKNFDPSRSHPMIFDWTQPYFSVQSNAPDIRYRAALQSPFFQRTNSITNHLSDAPDMQSDDGWELIRQDFGYVYQPSMPVDPLGLKRTTGSGDPAPVGNPFFILYNRYTGVLRVFIAVGQLSEHSGARMKIYQVEGNAVSPLQSSLLYESSEAKPLMALDDFVRPELNVISRFSNQEGSWLYADFPTTYDPCTCLYSSSIQIDIDLIEEAHVELTGETEGTLASITNNQGELNNDDRSMAFGLTNLIDGGKKAAESFKNTQDMTSKAWEAINAAKQKDALAKGLGNSTELKGLVTTDDWRNFYNSLTPAGKSIADELFQKYDKKKEEVSWLEEILASFSFLEKPLKYVPFVSAAVDVFDFFVGGGKKEPTGPQKVEVQPMAIRMTTKLQGTITAQHYYGSTTFFTPGSKDNATRLPETDYPMYNQTLGTFNLISTPKVKCYYQTENTTVETRLDETNSWVSDTCIGANTARRYYQLAEDVKYVVNPAAGFDMANIEILASLVFDFDYNIEQELRQYSHPILLQESTHQYRTRYVPLGCLKDLFVEFLYRRTFCDLRTDEWGSPSYPGTPPISRAPQFVWLKLVVRLPRADRDSRTQGVLFVGKYPVSITDLPGYNPAEWTTHSDYDDVPNDIAFTNQVAGRYSAWNTITVESGADVGNYSAGGVSLAKADLVAGERITVKPGGRVHQESSLRIGLPEVCTRSLPPASASEIMSFCNSSAYQAARQFPKDMSEDVEPRPGTNTEPSVLISISPNPSADRVAIRYHVAEPSPVTIEIVNPLGVVVGVVASMSEHKPGEHTASFDGSSLARGVYYCVLRCNGDVQAQQFVLY